MTKKEQRKLQEIESAAKDGRLKVYISTLRPEDTSHCINVIEKWREESELRHSKAWHKATNQLQKNAVEKTEMMEMEIIADLLFQLLKKKFLEGVQKKQRIRKNL